MVRKQDAPTSRERLGAWRKDWFRVVRATSRQSGRKGGRRKAAKTFDPFDWFARIEEALDQWLQPRKVAKLETVSPRQYTGAIRAALKQPTGHRRRAALKELIEDARDTARRAANRDAIELLESDLQRIRSVREIVTEYMDGLGRPSSPTKETVARALAGCREMELVESALAAVGANGTADVREYLERWHRGLRCVALHLLVDWLDTWSQLKPTRDTCTPWLEVLSDISRLLGNDETSEKLLKAIAKHSGSRKLDGKKKGAQQMIATAIGVSQSTVVRDERALSASLPFFNFAAQRYVSASTAAAIRDRISPVIWRLRHNSANSGT